MDCLKEQKEDVLENEPILSFGAIADVQYADIDDGYNFPKTKRRYYRGSLVMLDKAVQCWNNDTICRPQFVLQLGDAIDGLNKKHGISESSLREFLATIGNFNGTAYHVMGNHDYYNFTRDALVKFGLYSGVSPHCKPVKGSLYYSCKPHPKLRVLALDTYEISLLASPEHTDEYNIAQEIMKMNPNEDKSDIRGLRGARSRFLNINGAVSWNQLVWIEENLRKAIKQKQNVVVMGHCGVYLGATCYPCHCWNAPEVLALLQKYHKCVLAYISGHDHCGGDAFDQAGIFHIAFPGVIENRHDADFGVFYMYTNKLVLRGNGRVPNRQVKLRYPVN